MFRFVLREAIYSILEFLEIDFLMIFWVWDLTEASDNKIKYKLGTPGNVFLWSFNLTRKNVFKFIQNLKKKSSYFYHLRSTLKWEDTFKIYKSFVAPLFKFQFKPCKSQTFITTKHLNQIINNRRYSNKKQSNYQINSKSQCVNQKTTKLGKNHCSPIN
jgi:hypothetical protein